MWPFCRIGQVVSVAVYRHTGFGMLKRGARGQSVIHRNSAKVAPLAVCKSCAMCPSICRAALACWLVRRSEKMPLLKAQPLRSDASC